MVPENIFDSRIVVIDDSPVDLKMIHAILEKNSYKNILPFTNPAKAMVHILTSIPDLVIIDLFLGDVNAIELITKLKSNQKTRYLPIVIISSSDDEKLIIESLQKGADDYISKSKNAMEILIRVNNVLKREYYRKSMEYKQKQLEEDIRFAAKMQEKILTLKMPEVSGFRFDIFYLPYHIASGDFYKVMKISRDKAFFILADVSGHGVGATLLAFHLDILIQDYIREHISGDEKLDALIHDFLGDFSDKVEKELSAAATFVNDRLESEYGRMGLFITALMGIIDFESGQIHYISAGSPPPLIETGGLVRELKQKAGPPLGVIRQGNFPVNRLSMDFDRMLIYSDGIFEVHDHLTGQMLDISGLISVITGLVAEKRFTLNNLYTRVAKEYNYNFEDDISILLLEKKISGPGHAV